MALEIDEKIIRFIIWTLYFVGLYFALFWLSVLFFDNNENKKIKKKNVKESITIILPMYNEQDSIKETLKSVFDSDYPKNLLKVICVNDGSTDNTLKILKELNKKYDFILINQKNQGKYMALNNALKYVDTKYFACLDADSFIEKDSISNILKEFDEKDIVAVTSVMKVYKPENLLQKVQWLEYIINIYYKYIMGKLDCIHVTPGPLSVYDTKIIKELGGFKKAHLTEDLEMALRLQNNNYKIKQSLSGTVYTKTPKKLKAFINQRTRWYHGTVLNIKDYKHFIFNKKYEDFGIFHIPLVGVTGFLSVLGVSTAIYLSIKNIYHWIKRMYLTNFDFITYISNMSFNFNILDYNWRTIFSTIVLLGLTFFLIYLSFIETKERVGILKNIKYFFTFLYFFIIYRFIIAYIWVKVLLKLIFKKSNRWDKVN